MPAVAFVRFCESRGDIAKVWVGHDFVVASGAEIRVFNGTQAPLSLYGESKSIPFIRIERVLDGRWLPFELKWCANSFLARADPVIEPGETIDVVVPFPDTSWPVRIGVALRRDAKDEWQYRWTAPIQPLATE